MKYLNTAQRMVSNVLELIYVLVDVSGSMSEIDYKPNRKEGAIMAVNKLIETKARLYPQDQMAMVGFESRGHLLHDPVSVGENKESLYQSILKMRKLCGGTDFTAALKLVERSMSGEVIIQQPEYKYLLPKFVSNLFFEGPLSSYKIDNNDGIARRVIMLTDGGHGGMSNPVDVADRLKSSGVTIECIGIAGNRKNVDESLLKQIASEDENGTPRYYFIGDTSSLIKKYETMAHHIRPV